MEKIIKPFSGYLVLLLALLIAIGSLVILAVTPRNNSVLDFIAISMGVVVLILLAGIRVVDPNFSRIMVFLGKYTGTVKENGLIWINPLYKSTKVSLRAQNLNGQTLKVNDKLGNPIEIAAVIVWKVQDTYRAAFDVANYQQYVGIQSEAAVRHLAVSYPYDLMEDENAEITLRDGGDAVNEMLEKELNNRLAFAGISVLEARISHLAYAPEIAGAMLQRQQATAIVSARSKIVEGAVGMVEMALAKLSEKQIVQLDEERKAAMVSNLLVVLCGDSKVSPVVNTGTLHQ